MKQQDLETKSNLTMLTRDSNSSNSMKVRRRQSFAETLKCMETANMEIHVHMHMVLINFKKRHIFQAISWQNFVRNFTEMAFVHMVRDANIYIVTTISNLNWHTYKHSKKELDLPNKETTKSVVTRMLTASGQIWKQVMAVEPQKNLDLHVLNKSITKTLYKRT